MITFPLFRDEYKETFAPKVTMSHVTKFAEASVVKQEEINYRDSLRTIHGLLELNRDFIILSPEVFDYKGTQNTCENVWSLNYSSLVKRHASLSMRIYNNGKV